MSVKYSDKSYKKFPCPICGYIPEPIFRMKDRFKNILYISVCPNDGLIFLNPRWTCKQYEKYYKDEYDHMKRKHIFNKDIKTTRKTFKHGRSVLKRIKKYCKSPKTILDIGAGGDKSLDFLKSVYKNVNTYFIEPSIECQNQIKKRGHILVDFNTNIKFDLLISRHVLEHVNNPIEHLTNIRSLMNDKSLFLISFPNGGNMKKVWFETPHIYYFNEEIFNIMVKMVGLKNITHSVGKNEMWYLLSKCNPSDDLNNGLKYNVQINKIENASKVKEYSVLKIKDN